MSGLPNLLDFDARRFVTNRVVTVVGCLLVLVVPFFWAASVESGPALCASRGVLGIPCPGCGLTRAFCALARFDLVGAIRFNALCLVLLPLFIVAPCVALYELAQGRRCRWYRFRTRRLALWIVALVMVYHVGRLAVWACDGTLVDEYLKSAWVYRLLTG